MSLFPDDLVTVGKIGSAFGVKGWIHVHSYTEPRNNILNYQPWLLQELHGSAEAGWREIESLETRMHTAGIVARFNSCDDRELAFRYRGRFVAVRREMLSETGTNEFYWLDLLGLLVVNENKVKLGRVVEIIETGANSVLKVKNKRQCLLIPFVSHYVVEVKRGERIVVCWDPSWK